MKTNSLIHRVLAIILLYSMMLNPICSFAITVRIYPLNQAVIINSNSMLSQYTLPDFVNVGHGQEDFIKVQQDNFVNENSYSVDEIETLFEVSNLNDIRQIAKVANIGNQATTDGFSIGSTNELVDPFTGDFSYSIPILDVEGYPLILSYNSNIGMHDAASWVGLGWNLNVGAVSRDVRGIPDDFNGEDVVIRDFKQKDGVNQGYKAGGFFQVGFSGIGLGISALGGKYNDNYLGVGRTLDLSISASYRYGQPSTQKKSGYFLSPSIGLGYSRDTKTGISGGLTIGVSAGLSESGDGKSTIGLTYGRSKHSRDGVNSQSISLGLGYSRAFGTSYSKKGQNHYNLGSTSRFTIGTSTSTPRVYFNGASRSSNDEYIFSVEFGATTALSYAIGLIVQDYNSFSKLDAHEGDYRFKHPAFGYFHSGKREQYIGSLSPIMDFNRNAENEYSENMQYLPVSMQTHDVFYLNAAGSTGTYRAMRTDYGSYYDANTVLSSNEGRRYVGNDSNTSLSGVIDMTMSPAIGFGVAYSTGIQKGAEESGNILEGDHLLKFNSESLGNGYDKSIYFRGIGLVQEVDMEPWQLLNGNLPDKFILDRIGNSGVKNNHLVKRGVDVDYLNVNQGHVDKLTATIFNPVTVQEAINNNLNSYQSYDVNGIRSIDRNSDYRKNNHITLIEHVNTSGERYQYGIPVYVYQKSDVTFSCTGRNPKLENGLENGLVNYLSADNSVHNILGRSNLFDKNTVPSFSNSFLLTQILSDDYVDITGNGPTNDDIGNFYKFNYTQFYGGQGEPSMYGTRFPISGIDNNNKVALLNKGVLGSNLDDTGNFSYSQSEVWYSHSVESRNLYVEFILEDRKDAYSANEDGILDTSKPLKLLKELRVYNKLERENNPQVSPLQTVIFYYDYSLCKLYPSNLNTHSGFDIEQSGKLTLKAIRSFNGSSQESALAHIEFNYGVGSDNPNFSYANTDGWGNYKVNTSPKENSIYPYADQTKILSDQSARAWRLNSIQTPLGGRIEVDYESDTYAFVQDKRAMRHFDIYRMTDLFDLLKIRKNGVWNGTSKSNGSNMEKSFTTNYNSENDFCQYMGVNSNHYSRVKSTIFGGKRDESIYLQKFGKIDVKNIPCNVIIFKLDKEISSIGVPINVIDQQVAREYFSTDGKDGNIFMKTLFTKVFTEIKGNSSIYDLIPTMSDISDDYNINAFNGVFGDAISEKFKRFGAMPPNSEGICEYGYVIVDLVNTGKREDKGRDLVKGSMAMHPMQIAAMDYTRSALPDRVYGTDPSSEGDMTIDKKVFWSSTIYEALLDANYCRIIDSSTNIYNSIVRLYEPDNTKYGGGARVKELRYLDNWSAMTGEYDSQYRWVYNYDYGNTRMKYSSGVASFEPLPILDECELYEWHTYYNIKRRFADEKVIMPGPLAVQFYPSPIVGYEKVEITFQDGNKFGKATNFYHTAKNFPVKFSNVGIHESDANGRGKAIVKKENKLLLGKVREFYSFSQGYLTETNDYHGKIISSTISKPNSDVNEEDIIISKTSYEYFGSNEMIPLVDRLGNVSYKNVGIEYDMHSDSKYCKDHMKLSMFGMDIRTYIMFPAFFIIPLPKYTQGSRERYFYSTVLNKHINRSAVVKSIKTENLGSVNEMEYLAFDKYSGGVIMQSLNDEYDDKLYSVTNPAHWKYKELRDISETRNRDISIDLLADGSFLPNSGNNSELLTPGDIIIIDNIENQVVQLFPAPEDRRMYLIRTSNDTRYSPTSTGLKTVVLVKTGRKNRLGESMQSFVTKVNPIVNNKLIVPSDNILSSSAITYRDKLTTECGCDVNLNPGSAYNPYKSGLKGDLIVDRGYSWQSQRNYTDPHGIRFDGAYKGDFVGDDAFVPFYALDNSGIWQSINHPTHPNYLTSDKFRKWRSSGSMELFDQRGNPVQSIDAIGVSTVIINGYGDRYSDLTYISAVNAKKHQVGFDGFEDYFGMSTDDAKCRGQKAHFDFYDPIINGNSGASIDTQIRHSGTSSLKLPAGKTVSVSKQITKIECDLYDLVEEINIKGVQLQNCACIPTFAPSPGEYLFSAWIRASGSERVVSINVGTVYSFLPQGPSIDGWRKVEGIFNIPNNVESITINLENMNVGEDIYFDDIRIHPFLAELETVVYDSKTLLPMATHDGYNFTTFYGYDENLNLRRVKVETIDGIKTVSESESGSIKRFLGE